jgi:hypothetical protein
VKTKYVSWNSLLSNIDTLRPLQQPSLLIYVKTNFSERQITLPCSFFAVFYIDVRVDLFAEIHNVTSPIKLQMHSTVQRNQSLFLTYTRIEPLPVEITDARGLATVSMPGHVLSAVIDGDIRGYGMQHREMDGD